MTAAASLEDGAAVYRRAFFRGLRPEPRLSLADWSDKHRYLSTKSAAEPGRWRTDRTPYAREIMDCLSTDSPVEEVVFIKGAQIGGTEVGLNFLGYIMHYAPGPALAVQPTVELAERFSKQRLGSMTETCPVLRELVKDPRARDSGNTILSKEFPGGQLVLAGANSAAGLCSMPARYLFLDEVDRYPEDADGEGSPIELAEARTSTFARRKKFINSTPTVDGASAIQVRFDESDQRHFYVPCPFCDHWQVLRWERMRWERDERGKARLDTVHYACEACDGKIMNHHKTAMMMRGQWRATRPPAKGGKVAGFHLSALYSPVGWFSWADCVDKWEKAQGNPTRLRVFYNTILGLPYTLKAEDAPDWKALYDRREGYAVGTAPARACLLTAAVDVQKDRLEMLVVGWNRDEAWIVDKIVLPGDTSKEETWRQLDPLLERQWPHAAGGTLPVSLCLIDSGFNTTAVYRYVRTKSRMKVRAIKGRQALAQPIGQPTAVDVNVRGKRISRGILLWPVGTDLLKGEVYGRLKQERPTDDVIAAEGYPDGFVHFPELDDEFFKQLTAEQLMVKKNVKTGYGKLEWRKTYPQNEALDLFCYNLAAWYALGCHRWKADRWNTLACERGAVEVELPQEEVTATPTVAPEPPAPAPSTSPPAPPVKARRKRKARPQSSFW